MMTMSDLLCAADGTSRNWLDTLTAAIRITLGANCVKEKKNERAHCNAFDTGLRCTCRRFDWMGDVMDRKEKFTHGPWKAGESSRDGTRVEGPTLIAWCGANATFGRTYYGITRNEAKANAVLISAAPDLYEALCEAVREMESIDSALGYEFTHLQKMRAALAKARGES
jgi:hypothetical protein